ncbi:uncharacterized protein VTP21DRAFT_10044 [Calcarisporiella thermophila]|uniref:uncharacterized protein n=1 Tax=Calcarisporiella thermophila TaxID=911321 RepID=UPI003743E7F3
MDIDNKGDILPSSDNVPIVGRVISACGGAMLTSLLVTPLDVVKTRLQSQAATGTTEQSIRQCCREVFFSGNTTISALGEGSSRECIMAEPSRCMQSREMRGTLDGMVKIIRYEGVTSLWRGLSPVLIMAVPSTVIYYAGYDAFKERLRLKSRHSQFLQEYSPLIAGGTSRALAVTLISPLELLRTRLQAEHGGYRAVLDGIIKMVRTRGSRSLWDGLSATLWRDVPFSAIYWLGYERVKAHILSRLTKEKVDTRVKVLVSFFAGAISGSLAAIVTTPFDTVKTLRQIKSKDQFSSSTRMIYVMRQVIRERGIGGLMTGAIPRVLKITPSCAIMISSYEFGKTFFSEK